MPFGSGRVSLTKNRCVLANDSMRGDKIPEDMVKIMIYGTENQTLTRLC